MFKVTLKDGTKNEVSKGQIRKLRRKIDSVKDLPTIQEKTGYDTETIQRVAFWFPAIAVATVLESYVGSREVEPAQAESEDTSTPVLGEMNFEIAEQVRADHAAGMKYKELKAKYGKGESTLRDIVKYRTWKKAA